MTQFALIATLENFSVSNLAQSLSPKPYWFADYFFRGLFSSFPFDGFSADSSRQQAPLNAEGISTVCNVAHIFGPSAPYSITTVERGVFDTFKMLA